MHSSFNNRRTNEDGNNFDATSNPLLDSASPLTVMGAMSGFSTSATITMQQQQQQQQQADDEGSVKRLSPVSSSSNQQGSSSAAASTQQQQEPPPPVVGPLEPALALTIYSACSVSMILLNKLVMDTYHMDFPMGLLFLQNFAALLLVVVAKHFKLISYPALDMGIARKWLPLTCFFVAMLWTSMKSLKTMSVAAQTILKNIAIILTALGDWYWFKKRLTPWMFVAFGLMIFGSWLGSANDKWVTFEGVMWTFANIFCTVGNVLYMRVITGAHSQELGKWGPVFYNNLLSLPFLGIPALPTLPALLVAIENAPTAALMCLGMMVFVGAIMTFGVFWAMRVTSPTTYSVTGALNKVPLAFLGILIFSHYPTFWGYMGILCALSAGVMYAWVSRPAALQPVKEQRNV